MQSVSLYLLTELFSFLIYERYLFSLLSVLIYSVLPFNINTTACDLFLGES